MITKFEVGRKYIFSESALLYEGVHNWLINNNIYKDPSKIYFVCSVTGIGFITAMCDGKVIYNDRGDRAEVYVGLKPHEDLLYLFDGVRNIHSKIMLSINSIKEQL